MFTEGKVTEPTYLAAWGRQLRTQVLINLDERTGLDPRGLVELAVEAMRQEAQDERRKRGRAHDEYWCVFDVDEHTRLHQALDLARANGVRVALSNPNFELWILLHHRAQTAPLSKDEARRAVRDEMRIEKALPPDVIEQLLTKYTEAASRARDLDTMHVRNESDGNPSTSVPDLVESLRVGNSPA